MIVNVFCLYFLFSREIHEDLKHKVLLKIQKKMFSLFFLKSKHFFKSKNKNTTKINPLTDLEGVIRWPNHPKHLVEMAQPLRLAKFGAVSTPIGSLFIEFL
jgi:hypothetical protein